MEQLKLQTFISYEHCNAYEHDKEIEIIMMF